MSIFIGSPLDKIQAAFDERGIPAELYSVDSMSNTLTINARFLEAIRQYELWQPLELDFVESGGRIVTFNGEGA